MAQFTCRYSLLTISIALSLARLSFGCAASESDNPTVEAKAEAIKFATMPASEASRELDVAEWHFEQHPGFVRGVNQTGEVVAEFYVDPDRQTVESTAPATGFMSLATAEGQELPEVSDTYWHAFRTDLDLAAEAAAQNMTSSEAQLVNQAEWRSCWGNDLLACQSYGTWMIVNGYITGFICQITDWCGGMIGLAY